MKRLALPYYYVMYYASWLSFGLVGLFLNLACAILLPLPRTANLQRKTRASIRGLFDLWTRWFHATGVLRIKWVGFPAVLPRGTVYIANHPTLLDATLLLARMPDAFCIFKQALMRNPCIAPAAILSGYVCGGRDVDTVREAAEKVAAGQSLLVFPEGTRTQPGTRLGTLKPGFSLIAHRGRAPIQTVLIRSSPGLVTRGRPWWSPPNVLPATLEITFDRLWPYEPDGRTLEQTAQIESYLLSKLPDPVP